MKERLMLLANVSLFAAATIALGTLQTSLWFQIFGYFPAPAFWIPVLVYIALHRSTLETILFSYLIGFILSTMTAMPEGLLMSVCLGLALTVQLVKTRIYWVSASYIMMICGSASLVFHLYHWVATFMVEEIPLTSPQISSWLIEALLTPLVGPLTFPLFQWFDRVTGRTSGPENAMNSNDLSSTLS